MDLILVLVPREYDEGYVDEAHDDEYGRMRMCQPIDLVEKEKQHEPNHGGVGPQPVAIQVVREEYVHASVEEEVKADEQAR